MRKTLGDNVIASAELPTTETPRQNWAETIQEVIQQEQEKAERRLAEERAGMEETIRERGWTQGRIGFPWGGVLAAKRRRSAQNSADRRGGSGPGHEAQGVLEPQAVVLLCDL